MLFFAYHRDDYLISRESLDAVLAWVAELNEPQFGEDVAVWQGSRIVAVCRADGTVHRFDRSPTPPAAEAEAVRVIRPGVAPGNDSRANGSAAPAA
jgi:hypothetical protein